MGLADWLDAGFRFMTKDRSPEVVEAMRQLADAETQEDVDAAFRLLNAVLEDERAEREQAEREHERRSGRRRRVARKAPVNAAEQARDEFKRLREEALAREAAKSGGA